MIGEGGAALSDGRTCPSDRCYWKSGRVAPGSRSQPASNSTAKDPGLDTRAFSDATTTESPFSMAPLSGDSGLASMDAAGFSFSFQEWCNCITRWALDSKTGFSRYLASTFDLRRDGQTAPPTALFPLPLPTFSPYEEEGGPSSDLQVGKKNFGVTKALHVLISALNYVYWSRSSPPLDLLRRQPNDLQSRAISRLKVLLEACDHNSPVEVAACGRKNLQLVTRLKELAQAADALGLSGDPYGFVPSSAAVPVDNSSHPQLSPFSNLVPERLKLSGTANWDAKDFISPELYMPFQEPQVLELDKPVFQRGLPNFEVDKPSTVRRLFQRWDDLSLLEIHPVETITTGDSGRVKIFNAYKSPEWDRQIGDRRERNAWEAKLPGPSSVLPVGAQIARLAVARGHGLKVCVTDRSDYYHQLKTSLERSRTNVVYPAMPLKHFLETKAYQNYVARASAKVRPVDRTVHGDFLGGHRPTALSLHPETLVYGGFKAVLQGDHAGVEFGISAHTGLLREHGLLREESQLLADKLIRPGSLHEGLVIDDYFCIAKVPQDELRELDAPKSEARKAFDQAKEAYHRHGLAGSDPKDVIDATLASVVGAQIDSRWKTVQGGVLPIGAPVAKRLALSWISAKSSKLGVTSDALHSSLVGGLVSAFCFQKSMMSLLSELFKVIPAEKLSAKDPKMWTLSRKAADELILSAVLLPIAVSDALLPFHDTVYASDSSSHKGAFCSARVSEQVAEPLWQAGDFQGARIVLDPWEKQVLKEAGGWDDEDWNEAQFEEDGQDEGNGVERPLAQFFDFLEICGGSGVLSEEMARRGFCVGPVIDLTYSKQYDLLSTRVVEWLLFLVQNRRVKAIALEPPCTTFSAAAYPPCRSYRQPRGFNQKSSKVWIGNRLAFVCLALLMAASFAMVLALLETPRRSKMAWLKEWRELLSFDNVEETYTASCSFGSKFQKEFRFLLANMKGGSICRPCTRNHPHVRIEGKHTKSSAVYCPGLVHALGELFEKHLRALDRFTTANVLKADGLESGLVNELLRKAKWAVDSSWRWTGHSHINVLELTSAFQALKRAVKRGGGRVSLILDSQVAVRVIAKGRSSARSLMPLLRKFMAVGLAFGVAVSAHFGPTRLNVSDDPTRDVPLRQPIPGMLPDTYLSNEGIFKLAELPKLRRWISNWVALFLGICSSHSFDCGSLSKPYIRKRSPLAPSNFYHHILDFDSTLGFPGEGPSRALGLLGLAWPLVVVWILIPCSHGMRPRNNDDVQRASKRASVPLTSGRPVLPVTKSFRDKLLEQFGVWLQDRGTGLDSLLESSFQFPDRVVDFLIDYGKELYLAGRPYNHFAETINGISAIKPHMRRLVSSAWDLAISWLRAEPGDHHVACPFQILLALLSTCILWGWPAVAGMIALSWGAICRAGEVFAALRADLILPRDVLFSSAGVFLRVQEPKTRFKAARHQVARCDYEDLVELLDCAFGRLPKNVRLWTASGQLLRTRFRQLLRGIGLPVSRSQAGKPLDLGSLRAGGATHLLLVSEDSELVRRRGRWLASRTMEIYLQEAGSTQYFPLLPNDVKARVMSLAAAFPELLRRMRTFSDAQIPPAAWHDLFLQMRTDGNDGSKPGVRQQQKDAAPMRSKPKEGGRKEHELLALSAESVMSMPWRSSSPNPAPPGVNLG